MYAILYKLHSAHDPTTMSQSESEDNGPRYCTQSPEDIDNDIYRELDEKLGQLDRLSFINELLEMYVDQEDQLNNVRFSFIRCGKGQV